MKTELKVLLLIWLSMPFLTQATSYDTMDEAVKASKGKTSIVVLHHGSGWNRHGKYLKGLWSSPKFKSLLTYQIAQLEDLPTSVNELTEKDRLALEKESERTGKGMDRLIGEFRNKGKAKKFKEIKNYPALSLYDSDGNYVACKEGLEKMTAQELLKEVNRLQRFRDKRDFYLEKAEKEKGLKKATLLSKAIRAVTDYVPFKDRERRRKQYLNYIYKLFDEMVKLDPSDELGHARALKMDPIPYIHANKAYFDFEERKIKSQSELQTHLAAINKELADPRNKVLLPIELQAFYVIKYNIIRHLDQQEAKEVALEGASLAPETVLGLGLAGKYLIHYGPASVRSGWKARHSKENKWIFGENPVLEKMNYYITEPGTYQVTFEPRRGSMNVNSVKLFVPGEAPARAEKLERNTETFLLKVDKVSKKMTLEVEFSSPIPDRGMIRIKPYDERLDLSDIEDQFNF